MKRSMALLLISLAACEAQPAPSGASSATAKPESPPEPAITAAARPTAIAPPVREEPVDLPAPPDVAAPPADAKKTPSGLAFKILVPGKGKAHPGRKYKVTVNYTGWTADGNAFDSTKTHTPPGPTTFRVDGVIKGWTEGLQLMTKGEQRRFWIPSNLAYGDRPTRPGAPAGMLVFDVELVDFRAPPAPPPVPPDVRAPPPTATKTASGLAYRVLAKGTGTEHPKATSRVTVHYSGWTTKGKMFDSSVVSDEPVSFALNRVIKGWTEGVQLMVKGEKTRFWIPAALAYGDKPSRPGAPAGMLVFDIELLEIQ